MSHKPILRRIFIAARMKPRLHLFPGFEARVRDSRGSCPGCARCPMEIPSFGCLTLYMRHLDDTICNDSDYITLSDTCRDLRII